MILASSAVLDLVKDYNPVVVIYILVTTYLAVKWIVEQFTIVRKWYLKKLVNYHESENAKEKKENSFIERINQLEEWQGSDHSRLKGFGKQLAELETTNAKQNEMLQNLSVTVRDMRLETMRSKILDSVPKCIDLTSSNIGSEDYTNLFQTYTTYEHILTDNGLENSQIELAMKMIEESYRKRLTAELLTDYRHLPPEEIKKKIRKADDAISWWTYDDDKKNKSNTVV